MSEIEQQTHDLNQFQAHLEKIFLDIEDGIFITAEEIAAIANWQPIQVGFGRDDNQTGIRVRGIVDRINTGDIGCEMLADDGLSNYF